MTQRPHSRLRLITSVGCGAALLALSCVTTSAVAAEPGARGFYAGVMIGGTTLEDDGLFSGLDFDNSDTGYGIFGGYKILRYLAVEARILNLGSYSVEGASLDVTGLSAHVVGIIPFGKSGWELFGQLGLGSVNIDTGSGDEDNTVASAGLGVRFYPTPHFGISLQTDAYAYEEDDFGATYDLGVATTQLAFHYLF
jgi:OmpA-OmpF porin, OOP family